jgi:transposase
MSEAKLHVGVEQRITIKLLTKEGCKLSEICSRLKVQHGEKTLSNVSVYKWGNAFKKRRETVGNEPHERRPWTSVTGENSDFFLSGIRKLPDRWRKCIANQGDYVEK